MNAVYLDTNATTRLADECLATLIKTSVDAWQNPSSDYGLPARHAIANARRAVAKLLNVCSDDIIFTSGGTEANQMVLQTFTSIRALSMKPHIITTCIEHPSVLRPLKALESNCTIDLTIVPVDQQTGTITSASVIDALRPRQTVLISIMGANNETGAVLPLVKIVDQVRRWQEAGNASPLGHVYIHSDMAQVVGKLSVDLTKLGIDYATIAGHKFYGPRIGCLYARGLHHHSACKSRDLGSPGGSPLTALFLGGNQEFGFRAGTENTPMIAALGKACELALHNHSVYSSKMILARTHLEKRLKETFPPNSSPKLCVFGIDRYVEPYACGSRPFISHGRLPNTVHLVFIGPPWLSSRDILNLCSRLQASRGAACHSGELFSNYVLQAYGYSAKEIASALRLSVGRDTTLEEVDAAVQMLRSAVDELLAL